MECLKRGSKHYIHWMKLQKQQLKELTEIVEDTVEYACDQYTLSGELVWTVIECLATAKIAELKGELKAA